MPEILGTFVWYELMTTDTKAAEAFYRAVIGWNIQDSGMPGGGYAIVSAGHTPMGGLMALPAEVCEAGGRPGWVGYIGVSDVDALASRVEQLGGAIHRAPADIPGVGRFAVAADPQGAVFVLFTPLPGQSPPQGSLGQVGWHELYAGHLDSAYAFYAAVFGWTKGEAIDMGPMGLYQLFATGSEVPAGGMMTKPGNVPVPFWLYYVNVDDIQAAAARVSAHAGQVVHGPTQVPGGNWIAQCMDPQGAMFALVGPSK